MLVTPLIPAFFSPEIVQLDDADCISPSRAEQQDEVSVRTSRVSSLLLRAASATVGLLCPFLGRLSPTHKPVILGCFSWPKATLGFSEESEPPQGQIDAIHSLGERSHPRVRSAPTNGAMQANHCLSVAGRFV